MDTTTFWVSRHFPVSNFSASFSSISKVAAAKAEAKGWGKAQGFGGEWISFVVILDGQPIEHN